jgi:hypothetical protein
MLALLNAKKSEKSRKNDYSALVSAHQTPIAEMSVTAASSHRVASHKGPFLAADGEKQQRCHPIQQYHGKTDEFLQKNH